MKPTPANDSRAETAARIAAQPAGYKVCEGCDSIVTANTVLCPNCHSFRFDGSPARVVRQAGILGMRGQRSVTAGDLG
jgi:hypothetical protein